MKIKDLYHFIRKLLFEIILYLILQSLLLIVLAVLVLLYPYTLNILVAVGFILSAIITLYMLIRVAILFHKVKNIKKALLGK